MFFVNGIPNNQFEHYTPNDGDKILITYGGRKDIDGQLKLKPPSFNNNDDGYPIDIACILRVLDIL